MVRYRFLDAMGDVLTEGEFDDHPSAVAWATETDEEVQRVEYLGEGGDWRWAGPLLA